MPVPSNYKIAYRILSWSTLVVLVWTIVLVLKKSPAPNVPFDPKAAESAERKLDAADSARASGQSAQVALDRTELNSFLQQNLQLNPGTETQPVPAPGSIVPPPGASPNNPPATTSGVAAGGTADPFASVAGGSQPTLEEVQSSVKDVKVDMDGDLVKAYVIFNFHGQDLSLELDGHLSSENGYMKFDPVAGKLGSLPLPQSTLQAAVDRLMNSPENREKLKLPDGVKDIQVEDGQAKVTYGNQ